MIEEMPGSSNPSDGGVDDSKSQPGRRNTERDLFYRAWAADRNLYYNGTRIPYNPDLVEYARELRKHATREERLIWRYVRTLPTRAYRQRPIDNYIVDFFFPSERLVIEIDGGQHFTDQGTIYDAKRTQILMELGLRVVRFHNRDVKENLDLVCMQIWRELKL